MTNRGAYLLTRTASSTEHLAAALGVSGPAVRYWRAGEKKPSRAKRAALLRLVGIPVEAWDEPADSPTSILDAAARAAALPSEPTPAAPSEPPSNPVEKPDMALSTGKAPEAAPAAPRPRPVAFRPPPPSTTTVPRGAAAKARFLESEIEALMARLSKDRDGSPYEQAKILGILSASLERLARLTGELELTNARVLSLPFWQRIVEVSGEALRKWPDAAEAFAAAVERIEAEAGRAA